METTKTMQPVALPSAVYQVPSAVLGTRCVQGDLRATRGQVRPMTGAVAGLPVRIRPASVATFEGFAPPGGIRNTT
jgi:hypothetical protein